jgi:hypothetical protein
MELKRVVVTGLEHFLLGNTKMNIWERFKLVKAFP